MTDAPPPYPGIVPGFQGNSYGSTQGTYPQSGLPRYPGNNFASQGATGGFGTATGMKKCFVY